jgi:heterodisulfide reductase subunit A2
VARRRKAQGASVGKRPPVAVILCECGGELARVLQMDVLARAIKALAGVGPVRSGAYPCSQPEIEAAGAAFAKAGVDRVVVAGCSERLFGKFFRTGLARFGIHPSLVEFADIKSLSALIRKGSRAASTRKAAQLVAAAVVRIAGAARVDAIEAPVLPVCAVIGGGITGMSAASALASRGVKVVLIEKEETVGGLVKRLNIVFPAYTASEEFVEARRADIEAAGVEIISGTEPVSVTGHVGGFEIALSDGRTVKAGAIIVATGADLLVPEGLFEWGKNSRVVTQMDLEAMLKRGENPGANVVMIQCAGSRNEARPYCSRVCCTASIVNTIAMKEKFPTTKITVLSRGFAEYAGDLDRARQMGVEIIRYRPERPPVVGEKTVNVYDEISEMEAHIPYDRVVLAVPLVPSESTRKLAAMLKMPTDSFGFMIEPHLKVRPEELAPRGIFVAGCAHWPSTITESVVQAYGAASRAFDLISAGKVVREALVARLDPGFCRGCGRCAEVCRHGAIDLVVAEDGLKQAEVIPIACTGCGVCVSVCPSGAVTLAGGSAREAAIILDALMEA